jgi:hypothetical protein
MLLLLTLLLHRRVNITRHGCKAKPTESSRFGLYPWRIITRLISWLHYAQSSVMVVRGKGKIRLEIRATQYHRKILFDSQTQIPGLIDKLNHLRILLPLLFHRSWMLLVVRQLMLGSTLHTNAGVLLVVGNTALQLVQLPMMPFASIDANIDNVGIVERDNSFPSLVEEWNKSCTSQLMLIRPRNDDIASKVQDNLGAAVHSGEFHPVAEKQ